MKVEFFDSAEEAMASLQQAMKAADARVRPWQAVVQPGDCFISVVEDDLVVFGEVLEGYREEHLRHYRFCRCFSVACPEGELGDVHVSTVSCRISRRFFEEMRQAGWAMEAQPPAPGMVAGPRPLPAADSSGWPAAGGSRQILRCRLLGVGDAVTQCARAAPPGSSASMQQYRRVGASAGATPRSGDAGVDVAFTLRGCPHQ